METLKNTYLNVSKNWHKNLNISMEFKSDWVFVHNRQIAEYIETKKTINTKIIM